MIQTIIPFKNESKKDKLIRERGQYYQNLRIELMLLDIRKKELIESYKNTIRNIDAKLKNIK